MSTQCSTQTAEMVTDNVNGQEDCNFKSAPDSAAHAHCGNESGEKELLRTEENQETSALEKKGINEAQKTKPEDLTAREDTRISHENIMPMQHQNPEVNGEFKQTGPGEGNRNEEEKSAAVPRGSRALDTEDGSEECPGCEEGAGECCPSALSCAAVFAFVLLHGAAQRGLLGLWEPTQNTARARCFSAAASSATLCPKMNFKALES